MNVPLLRKIQKHILAEPRRVNMGVGLFQYLDPPVYLSPVEIGAPDWRQLIPPCGTVGCIAGWATILSGATAPAPGRSKDWYSKINTQASNLLDLNPSQAAYLFHIGNWRYPWRDLDELTPGTREYAQVVSDYIDYYIASKGGTV